jgi:DNA repair exonuclease SbcCD ATPase subunit
MKRMQLLQLTLTNFKGVRYFVLDSQGENVKAFGDNATGKTTLFDAFVWLLFDKDSQNKKDFEIKTLDSNNNPIHGLKHEVEGVFDIDGRKLTLKKVFSEKWTKKRGSATSEFTGHTTDYYIDGVPSKQKEYKERVDEIVNEDVFKLLTSPTFFNEQLNWQKRRETLLQVCGDITDNEVIASDKKLSKLPAILNGRSIEDHRKVIAAKRKEINQELERIPDRIDEVNRLMPDLTDLDEKALKDQIAGLKIRVESEEGELSRIQNGGEISAKEKQLRQIEGELLTIKNQLNADTYDKVHQKREALNQIKAHIDNLNFDIGSLERQSKQIEDSIRSKESLMQRLRSEWSEENDKQFDFGQHQTTCYACGQDLPVEQIEDARSKAEDHFNQEKAQKLERIQSQGKAEKFAVDELKDQKEHLFNEIFGTKEIVESEKIRLDKLQIEIDTLQSSVVKPETDLKYQMKSQAAETVKQEIQTLKTSVQESIDKVRGVIRDFKVEIASLENDQSKFSQAASFKKRIEELTEQEKTLAAEYERLEEELYLTEEFIRTKVNLLESKINSKFKYARFKLFTQQINGGLQETCETLYNGVPYGGGLNDAAKINVGLDIINTLSEYYGLSAPIFIDNSESVTKFIDVNSQVISLVVSEKDKQLRVEIEPQDLKEAI